jgi:hypothetical protein
MSRKRKKPKLGAMLAGLVVLPGIAYAIVANLPDYAVRQFIEFMRR